MDRALSAAVAISPTDTYNRSWSSASRSSLLSIDTDSSCDRLSTDNFETATRFVETSEESNAFSRRWQGVRLPTVSLSSPEENAYQWKSDNDVFAKSLEIRKFASHDFVTFPPYVNLDPTTPNFFMSRIAAISEGCTNLSDLSRQTRFDFDNGLLFNRSDKLMTTLPLIPNEAQDPNENALKGKKSGNYSSMTLPLSKNQEPKISTVDNHFLPYMQRRPVISLPVQLAPYESANPSGNFSRGDSALFELEYLRKITAVPGNKPISDFAPHLQSLPSAVHWKVDANPKRLFENEYGRPFQSDEIRKNQNHAQHKSQQHCFNGIRVPEARRFLPRKPDVVVSKFASKSFLPPNVTVNCSNRIETNFQRKLFRTYRCKQCDYVAKSKDDYWAHSRVHIKVHKLLSCPKCLFVTEHKHHLEYHLRNHFNSKPYKCAKCAYSCVNNSMLKSHMKSHTNLCEYRCADCNYATKYCHSLKLHLRKRSHKAANEAMLKWPMAQFGVCGDLI